MKFKQSGPFTLSLLLLGSITAVQQPAFAVNYGIYEARAAGMGGVGVAVGNHENAIFYNPALLSFHDRNEDEGRDGRFFFPVVAGQYYEEAFDVLEAVEDNDLDQRLDDAVAAYNADPVGGALQVSALIDEFEDLAFQVADRDYIADAFVGMVVAEPAKREGGSFYLGTRLIAGGRVDYTAEDQTILNDYRSYLNIIGGGGTPGAEFDYLLDDNGNLIDPSDGVTSRYDVGAVGITEVGLSLSKEFEIYGYDIAFGVSPKAKRTDVYREARSVASTDTEFRENAVAHYSFNFDLGVAAEFYDAFRVGLAIKDVVPESFRFAEDSPEINFQPRTRLGMGYVNNWVAVGLDVDVVENKPVAGESPSQDVSFGVEFNPLWTIDLRFGYKHDLSGFRSDVMTGGFAWSLGFFAMEASYMQSDEMQGGALQIGLAF